MKAALRGRQTGPLRQHAVDRSRCGYRLRHRGARPCRAGLDRAGRGPVQSQRRARDRTGTHCEDDGTASKAIGGDRCAQKNALRVLNDWREDEGDRPFELSDPEQMERFFNHHFFARKDQMDYPVKAQRDDTLLQMLGENAMAVHDARMQGTAGRLYAVVQECSGRVSCA